MDLILSVDKTLEVRGVPYRSGKYLLGRNRDRASQPCEHQGDNLTHHASHGPWKPQSCVLGFGELPGLPPDIL